MSTFKKVNRWLNLKIIYPLFSRIYWNFSVVAKFNAPAALMRQGKDSSEAHTDLFMGNDAKLLRSRFPNGEFIEYLARKYRLKSILSLEDDYDKDMDIICAKYKINHIKSLNHISAKTIFQDEKDLKKYLKLIHNANNFPMLIRCRAGADRTGVACALYRIEKQRWKNFLAWLEMLTFFHVPFKFKWASKFVLNYKKGI